MNALHICRFLLLRFFVCLLRFFVCYLFTLYKLRFDNFLLNEDDDDDDDVADSFHTKKLCSRISSSEVRFYTKIGRFAFLSPPPLVGLGATYDVHLRLIGKRVVDFLLVFFARC